MKKWKYFCRKPLVKAICIFLVIISVITCGASLQFFVNYMEDTGENLNVIFEDYGTTYTESSGFAWQLESAASEVLRYYAAVENFEKNGKFDGDRVVDLFRYEEDGIIDGVSESGISYRLEELLAEALQYYEKSDSVPYETIYVCQRNMENQEIAVAGAIAKTEYTVRDDGALIVTESLDNAEKMEESEDTPDGTAAAEEKTADTDVDENLLYYYMTAKEFRNMLGLGTYEEYSGPIYRNDGALIYEDCWPIEIPMLSTQPIEGDWLDLFNTNAGLNGNIVEYSTKAEAMLQQLYTEYNCYKNGIQEYDAEKSNLRYAVYNPQTKQIYTNDADYQEKDSFESYLERMKEERSIIAQLDGECVTANWKNNSVIRENFIYGLRHYYYYDYVSERENNLNYCFSADETFPVDDIFRDNQTSFEKYAPYVTSVRWLFVIGLVVLLISLVILTFGFGRTETGELELNAFDRWKTELAIAFILVVWGVIFGMGTEILREYKSVRTNYLFLGGVISIPTAIFFLIGYASLVKRLKTHTFWKNSICGMICRWIWHILKQTGSILKDFFHHLNLTWRVCLIMIGVILLHWLAFTGFFLFVIAALIAEAVVFVYVTARMAGEQKILEGLRKIKEGNLENNIDTEKMMGKQKEMAELLNHVDEGLSEAIEKQIKSERMKTELITNVSHDIKTPLTSIINYVDLLKRETSDMEKANPEKVKEYLNILEQKSQRLKTLTEDVVEASKISSGTLIYENVCLDLVEMLSQVEGEYLERYEEAGLQLLSEMPEPPAVIFADGRRVWRIFSNLYQNTVKYAMPNTRVYVNLTKENGQAVFTMKNISQAPLNISPDELTERFIRGDQSRTTEGSGLGLSIAKSLTEAMKGEFEIYLDGDLFKVTVKFPLQKMQ